MLRISEFMKIVLVNEHNTMLPHTYPMANIHALNH